MALPKEPVVKKFFTNKIESTRDDWYGYLVQIARIFYTLDGEEYNRDILMNKFATMSGRDATRAQRDSSNFRDEFGAYGTYLGVYHLEQRDGKWYVFVSDAAKKFLCCQTLMPPPFVDRSYHYSSTPMERGLEFPQMVASLCRGTSKRTLCEKSKMASA